jgi:hypothetical protein
MLSGHAGPSKALGWLISILEEETHQWAVKTAFEYGKPGDASDRLTRYRA